MLGPGWLCELYILVVYKLFIWLWFNYDFGLYIGYNFSLSYYFRIFKKSRLKFTKFPFTGAIFDRLQIVNQEFKKNSVY